jgi:hypothetical protein
MSRAPAKTISEYIGHAWEDGAREERQNVVAWLRSQSQLTLYEATPDDVANAIERGDHIAELEREAVLALLRAPIDGVVEEACLVAADAIERGEHRRKEDE